MKKLLYLIILAFVIATNANSQTGTVRGFVYEKETGEPIIFTSVYLQNTTYGTATDVNGFYSISKVKPGNYTLVVTYIGYDTVKVPVKIIAGEIQNQKVEMTESSIKLDEFIVSAQKQELQTTIHASVTKVSPKQISQLPSIGAVPDIAQFLQVVPGVVFTGDQGGQLYIRGGSPIQNKVLLDGMVVYNPFHSIGLFSVFDSDILRNTDVFTGGFNSDYGGRISSVMDITTRDGNKKRFKGKLSGDTFGAKLLVEGPIIKADDNDKLSLSYVLSAKTSYLEQTSKQIYKYANQQGLPFGFNDFYGKLSLNSAAGSKVNVFGFRFSDYVANYQDISDLNWESMGVGSNIVLVPQGAGALITANVAYSNYKIAMASADDKPRTSDIGGFNMGLKFTYFLGDNQLDYGVELLSLRTNFEFNNENGAYITQVDNTAELGAYIKYKVSIGNLLFEPGFRLQYYASLPELSPEPRLGLKYKINNNLRIKAAAGLYSQNLIAANSDKDVVNLFYGFLSGPQRLQDEFNGRQVKSSLQKSRHFILGVEYDLNQFVTFNVEGYYKYNPQTTELNRNKMFDDDASNAFEPEMLKKDFILEEGDAYGVDFLLKYDIKNLNLWAVYSLGKVNRLGEFLNQKGEVEVLKYSPHFDRRHNINLMVSYVFGRDLNWEAGIRWNYGSGFPFTKNDGYYEKIPFLNGINTNYTDANGRLAYILGDINNGRLPDYHRLDANIKRTFFISDWSELQLIASVTNIYNRKNMFYVDRVRNQKVYQLPILPSIGLSLTF